ncbi:MAG: methyltransferase domain-containing protein [Planctomycetes bacterium]|nr:methyltransferase domain-containing protein [Planctomycetota bacterium]
MSHEHRPTWNLPPGVSRGLWDYVQSPSVADDYDDYFAFNSLFEHDEQVLARHLQPAGLVADLGCGTGRALVPLVRAGHRGLAIDLSDHMLRIVQEKADLDELPIDCLQANLVELDALGDQTVDHAICMFSTLGMIRGRANRRQALRHCRRILKPGGRFVLHVHNYWFNLRDPQGPSWLIKNLLSAPLSQKVEIGDKWFPYRGVPNMFLHVFRWSELAADLADAQFEIVERIPLDVARRHRLRWSWLLGAVRTNGWIVICD